ncbi:NHLP leader peptide family RiPP precursor [Salibacterium sp. K-3]
MNGEKTEAALKQVNEKAAADETFRHLCLTDPHKAIKDASGMDIPEGMSVRFVENEGADATFVLPDPPFTGQLEEDELEKVAGGHIGKPEKGYW